MLTTLYRLLAHLFHGDHTSYPPLIPPSAGVVVPPRRGIPDGCMEKVPPLAERQSWPVDAAFLVRRHLIEVSDASRDSPNHPSGDGEGV